MYNFLFYKAYQLGQRSSNFDDMPWLYGVMWVGICLQFNVFTILFMIEAAIGLEVFSFPRHFKYPAALGLIVALSIYYLHHGRYRRIVAKYERREQRRARTIHPLVIILPYVVASFILLLLAAMFRNHDGVFR